MIEIVEGASGAARFLGINRDTIHRHIKRGTFPTPISTITLGENSDRTIRAWKKEDLENWKKERNRTKKGWEIGRKRKEGKKNEDN